MQRFNLDPMFDLRGAVDHFHDNNQRIVRVSEISTRLPHC